VSSRNDLTSDPEYEIRQLQIFRDMVGKGEIEMHVLWFTIGMIYRQLRPVYWSPSTRTALAEAELEYKDDHVTTAAYVKFRIADLGTLTWHSPISYLRQVKHFAWTS
jgi:isoleucyl-tRNA synthetase